MTLWRPDPSFYPSPRQAIQAPPERYGYVAALNYGRSERPDALHRASAAFLRLLRFWDDRMEIAGPGCVIGCVVNHH